MLTNAHKTTAERTRGTQSAKGLQSKMRRNKAPFTRKTISMNIRSFGGLSSPTPTIRQRSRNARFNADYIVMFDAQPRRPGGLTAMLALTQLFNYLTLKGSFSAVSKPNFASKYALESSRRDLHNALLCTALKSH